MPRELASNFILILLKLTLVINISLKFPKHYHLSLENKTKTNSEIRQFSGHQWKKREFSSSYLLLIYILFLRIFRKSFSTRSFSYIKVFGKYKITSTSASIVTNCEWFCTYCNKKRIIAVYESPILSFLSENVQRFCEILCNFSKRIWNLFLESLKKPFTGLLSFLLHKSYIATDNILFQKLR